MTHPSWHSAVHMSPECKLVVFYPKKCLWSQSKGLKLYSLWSCIFQSKWTLLGHNWVCQNLGNWKTPYDPKVLNLETRSLNANCPHSMSIQHPSRSRNIGRYRLGLRARICFGGTRKYLLINPTLLRQPPLTAQFQFSVSTCLNLTNS